MQGGALAYMMLSTMPEMQSKVSVLLAMGPPAFLEYMRAPFLKAWATIRNDRVSCACHRTHIVVVSSSAGEHRVCWLCLSAASSTGQNRCFSCDHALAAEALCSSRDQLPAGPSHRSPLLAAKGCVEARTGSIRLLFDAQVACCFVET